MEELFAVFATTGMKGQLKPVLLRRGHPRIKLFSSTIIISKTQLPPRTPRRRDAKASLIFDRWLCGPISRSTCPVPGPGYIVELDDG
jgi:hypothetical protein